MKKGKGIPVFGGIAFGEGYLLQREDALTPYEKKGKEEEKLRFEEALTRYRSILEDSRPGLEGGALELSQLYLDLSRDGDFLSSVFGEIDAGKSAPEALEEAGERLRREFLELGDEYMSARGEDVLLMSQAVADVLLKKEKPSLPEGEFIIIARDISPTLLSSLPRKRILGLVLQEGTTVGHTAILARAFSIPSLVKSDVELSPHRLFAVDSINGEWYSEPDDGVMDELKKRKKMQEKALRETKDYRNAVTRTKRGRNIEICANISNSEQAREALFEGCEGIGLYRSEFFYLNRKDLPSEEELFESYKEVAELLGQRPTVIRTIDIGSDKPCPAFSVPSEENPALGLRGIRLCLENREAFSTQLRAIYRAADYGNVAIMFPMISSEWELCEAVRLCGEVREKLGAKRVRLGAMVETPAGAIISDRLARISDFFCVGTNDLIQYTLAADRQNWNCADYYDGGHPAVTELLGRVAKNGRNRGREVSVCGELAADSQFAPKFIEMGYGRLSVAPSLIPQLRKRICELDI